MMPSTSNVVWCSLCTSTRNAPLPGDQLVGLGLTPEKPDVDVPAGTVFRNGIEKAQAVALEQHHRDRMLAVERREAGDGPLLPAVDLFDPFDVDGPLQAQRPGRPHRFGQELHPVPRLASTPCTEERS